MTYVAPGLHLLIDFWECTTVQTVEAVEALLRDAAQACGATVLEIRLHHFGGEAGITGVAILAESHISIHTWPETGYVALDVFMCGACDPHLSLPILKKFFRPKKASITEHRRGG